MLRIGFSGDPEENLTLGRPRGESHAWSKLNFSEVSSYIFISSDSNIPSISHFIPSLNPIFLSPSCLLTRYQCPFHLLLFFSPLMIPRGHCDSLCTSHTTTSLPTVPALPSVGTHSPRSSCGSLLFVIQILAWVPTPQKS